jgi:hypothetical protein
VVRLSSRTPSASSSALMLRPPTRRQARAAGRRSRSCPRRPRRRTAPCCAERPWRELYPSGPSRPPQGACRLPADHQPVPRSCFFINRLERSKGIAMDMVHFEPPRFHDLHGSRPVRDDKARIGETNRARCRSSCCVAAACRRRLSWVCGAARVASCAATCVARMAKSGLPQPGSAHGSEPSPYAIKLRLTRRFWRPLFSILPTSTVPISPVLRT